ncbi:dTDP-4-dehydrorhamnose reductase [Paenibacillus sp. 2003]|uniref:dTDP-4-dehydrorhamnose reductase n=1 Tax=Paenibacillus sp. 2003 TaxID=2817761 RepID=UPI002860DACA|nr:dTDP-4-dehydrorhamnose reductase [Paenibacillus sp. 2003]MDR6720354.1 dTDP-4-dehydrorhamnose reductase [Paenibacillus sp. 2003]
MKVLVTGIGGQLGYDIFNSLQSEHTDIYGVDKSRLDLTEFVKVKDYIVKLRPDIVIHCAAYTNVDLAEEKEDFCRLINAEATANIADACREIDAKMVYFSTDYVFSGEGDKPHEVESATEPLSVYGRTKLAGEREVLDILEKYYIIRTSWSYGLNGNNFVKTMLRLGQSKSVVNVVKDQFGSPTYTKDLASLVIEMIKTDKYGVYHVTNEGYCSWAELAEAIFNGAGYATKVDPIHASDFPTLATRPRNSRLSKTRLDESGFSRLPTWQDALNRYLKELKTKGYL